MAGKRWKTAANPQDAPAFPQPSLGKSGCSRSDCQLSPKNPTPYGYGVDFLFLESLIPNP